MRIIIKVIAGSSCNQVVEDVTNIETQERKIKVKTTTIAEKGKANKIVIEILAKYFKVSKSQVKIINGDFSSNKIIEIID